MAAMRDQLRELSAKIENLTDRVVGVDEQVTEMREDMKELVPKSQLPGIKPLFVASISTELQMQQNFCEPGLRNTTTAPAL